MADPRGRASLAPPLGPNPFNFMQFSANILQNNRLAHRLLGSRPSLGNPESEIKEREMAN